MSNTAMINRPMKFGPADRREFIVQDSEVALRAENDANGNPVYLARAKIGTATSEEKWQICYLTYDANQGVTSVTWPQDSDGNATGDYKYSYDDRATYTYS